MVAHQELSLDGLLGANLAHLRRTRHVTFSLFFFKVTGQSNLTGCSCRGASHLVAHVWQVLKAHGGAEHLVMHIHDLVLVTARVQVVHCVLDDVQSLVARCLQVVLGRQVGPEGACQAGMVAQVAALGR